MKAIVKATGEIIELCNIGFDKNGNEYCRDELDFIDDFEPDYWEKLKHQYAGMAMQQMVNHVNTGYEYVYEETAIVALNFATALVNKLKEESQCQQD